MALLRKRNPEYDKPSADATLLREWVEQLAAGQQTLLIGEIKTETHLGNIYQTPEELWEDHLYDLAKTYYATRHFMHRILFTAGVCATERTAMLEAVEAHAVWSLFVVDLDMRVPGQEIGNRRACFGEIGVPVDTAVRRVDVPVKSLRRKVPMWEREIARQAVVASYRADIQQKRAA